MDQGTQEIACVGANEITEEIRSDLWELKSAEDYRRPEIAMRLAKKNAILADLKSGVLRSYQLYRIERLEKKWNESLDRICFERTKKERGKTQ